METKLPRKLEGRLLEMALNLDYVKKTALLKLEALEKDISKVRSDFWLEVHSKYADIDLKIDLTVDLDYAELGVVFLKESENGDIECVRMPEGLKDLFYKIMSK